MNNNIDYESIKDSVVYSFEEYVEEDGFTAPQAAAKTFEEEWRELNYNDFKGDTNKDDIEQLLQDIHECKQLMENKNYKVIESSFSAKARIEYILSLKP